MAEVNTSVEEKLPIASSDDNIDFFWRKWLTVFLDAMNRSIPTRHVPIKSATPWITNDIEGHCQGRERMYRKAPTPRTMFHDTRELETPSLPRFVSLRNPSLRNFPIL